MKRYDIQISYDFDEDRCCYNAVERDDGEYVLYSDVAVLIKENARLREVLERIVNVSGWIPLNQMREMHSIARKARKALAATAQDDGLSPCVNEPDCPIDCPETYSADRSACDAFKPAQGGKADDGTI